MFVERLLRPVQRHPGGSGCWKNAISHDFRVFRAETVSRSFLAPRFAGQPDTSRSPRRSRSARLKKKLQPGRESRRRQDPRSHASSNVNVEAVLERETRAPARRGPSPASAECLVSPADAETGWAKRRASPPKATTRIMFRPLDASLGPIGKAHPFLLGECYSLRKCPPRLNRARSTASGGTPLSPQRQARSRREA